MPERLLQLLVRLYPQSWRAQYGAELVALAREAYARGYQSLLVIAGDLLLGAFVQQCRKRGRIVAVLATIACVVGSTATIVSTGSRLDGSGALAVVPTQHSSQRAGSPQTSRPKPARYRAGTKALDPGFGPTNLTGPLMPSDGGAGYPSTSRSAAIRLNPGTGRVTSAQGAMLIIMQPKTGRILSVSTVALAATEHLGLSG